MDENEEDLAVDEGNQEEEEKVENLRKDNRDIVDNNLSQKLTEE